MESLHTCQCGNQTLQAITRHPVSGRRLPVPVCRECAEKLVREPYNQPHILREPPIRRRLVKEIGEE